MRALSRKVCYSRGPGEVIARSVGAVSSLFPCRHGQGERRRELLESVAMRTLNITTVLLLTGLLLECSPASTQPLPRLERYDFIDQTPADLVRLRQIAPAEGPEGALARYALARAHAEWLILGLVLTAQGDTTLRRLAVNLEVEGASLDDELTLEQVLSCVDRVLLEVSSAGDAGGEARDWSRAMERLLEAIRSGWERFDPDLFRAVVDVASEDGPARLAADLLAVGWASVALGAMGDRPEPERARFLVRMAGYFDIDEVEALAEGRESLWGGSLDPTCDEVDRRLGGLSPFERLSVVRRSCSGRALGLDADAGQILSPELIAGVSVLRDLIERRRRLEGHDDDPLRIAAAGVIAAFDRAFQSFRLPLPPPTPGPHVPTPAVVSGPGAWHRAAAVVAVGAEGEPSVRLWPSLAVIDGAPRVLGLAPVSPPGGGDLAALLTAAFERSSEVYGTQERSVAILIDGGASSEHLMRIVEACQAAEVDPVDVIAHFGDVGYSSLPVAVERSAARNRTSSERRAILVMNGDGLQLGDADGRWTEYQREGDALQMSRLEQGLAEHVRGRGNAGVIVAVRPGTTVTDVMQVLDFLSRLPRAAAEEARRGWSAWLDPEEPPAPAPVANTAAGAVAHHRVRLRSCYERYLRNGGRAQGMLVLELSVNGDGEVTSARVATSELGPQPALDNCLIGEAQRIRFPADTDAPVIRVPLRFVPERGDRR